MPEKDDFKTLQEYWEYKLAESGFKDIERCNKDNYYMVPRVYQNVNTIQKEAKETYFARVTQAIEDDQTLFKNEADKFIMLSHAKGLKIKDIVSELSLRGTPRERKSVRIIIRRYIMMWNIRYFNRRQLNMER